MILDGRKIREKGLSTLSAEVSSLSTAPVLAVVQVGQRSDSNSYIEQKRVWSEKAGIELQHIRLDEETSFKTVADEITRLNNEPKVHGIIIQLPLPPGLDSESLINLIDPIKDIDGLTPVNVKRRVVCSSEPYYLPATARGILTLLDEYGIEVQGKKAIVIGRSALVGRPVADALLARDATVTLAHSKTPNLKESVRINDIVIVCIGRAREITTDFLSKGQTVIDVGISTEQKIDRLSGEEVGRRVLVGDVDFDAAKDVVENITPVPGGVGPLTVLSVLQNTLDAYKRQCSQ